MRGVGACARAEEGIRELKDNVDTLISIPNQRLLAVASRSQPLVEAFHKADEVLLQAVRGISDLITVGGLINLDFCRRAGRLWPRWAWAIMGAATANGEGRAEEAARRAIASPLLEDISISGARGILINVTGGPSMTLHEVNEAATLIQDEADEEANVIFGTVINESMGEDLSITVIATGFGQTESAVQDSRPPALSSVKGGLRTPAGPRKVVHLGTLVDDELDTPTWQRKQQTGKTEEETVDTPPAAETGDSYDIPAFLRKQAK